MNAPLRHWPSNINPAAEPSGEDDGHWLSVSDLMATLMMVFLFIAVLHMVQVERSHALESTVRTTATQSRQAIYQALEEEFRDDLARWNAEIVRPTLTLRFHEPDVLFDRSSAHIKPQFQAILNDFLPRYVARLTPFREVIREIRIEGHTSSEWGQANDALTAYFGNMQLSQQRAQAVLHHAYRLPDVIQADWFRQRVAAIGLSSSRPILTPSGAEDSDASRRVELSVLTDFESRLLAPIDLDQTSQRHPPAISPTIASAQVRE